MKNRRFMLLLLVSAIGIAGCAKRSQQRTETAGPAQQVPAGQPAPAPQPAKGETAAAVPQGAVLEFKEFVTGGAAENELLPMVVALHGLGDTPKRFRNLFLGVDQPMRVILPQAPKRYSSGYSWFDTEIKRGKVRKVALEQIEESARRVAELATELAKKRPTSGKPAITGFSQGGMLSFMVAVYHPDTISLAVPIGGLIPEKLWPAGEVKEGPLPRIVALHGKDDRLVPFSKAKATVEHLAKLGHDARLEQYEHVAHRLSYEMRARLFELLRDNGAGP